MSTLQAWGRQLLVFVVLLLVAWITGLVGNLILKGMLILAGLAIIGFCGYWFPRMRDVDGADIRYLPGAGILIGITLLLSLWIHR